MSEIKQLRFDLALLRARYDSGANGYDPAIFRVVRDIETEIAWGEYVPDGRRQGARWEES